MAAKIKVIKKSTIVSAESDKLVMISINHQWWPKWK